jgi:oxygen-independent coproporphyrinogen-3 oxidase
MTRFSTLPPLSLYVHLPWCVRKCPYCDFNSHALRDALPERAYVAALLRDLEYDLPRVYGRTARTIFIGGGTPSLFSPDAISELLSGIRARIGVAPDAEITLEANPGTVDSSRFEGFRQAGVNRLSIGMQSFDDAKLAALGRIHGGRQARAAAHAARSAGFENFNLDLMFGLPGQSCDEALTDVRSAIELNPTHLSMYQLTIEPNTRFHTDPPPLPDDETLWDMQERIQAELARSGYAQYEVSAYARAGFACRHNLNYWQFGDYLGIGAGAHAKITAAESDAQGRASAAGGGTPGAAITRLWKVRHPDDYLTHAGTARALGGETRVADRDVPFEFMLNALRLTDGFEAQLFSERTGLALAAIEPQLADAARRGLLQHSTARVCATPLGRRFLNDLVAAFLPTPRDQAQRRARST